MDVLLVILCALAMVVGLFGVILPVLPGISLIWLSALVYGVVDGFTGEEGWTSGGVTCLAVITVLAVVAVLANIYLPTRRAGVAGANWMSIGLGIVGAIIGFFAVPVIGLFIGAALGVWIGEFAQGKEPAAAWQSTRATLIGLGLSFLVQMLFGLVMMAVWVGWLIWA